MNGETTADVRELATGEAALWLSLDPADGGGPDRLTEFERAFEEKSAADGRSFLIALEGGRPVGRLEGTFLAPELYAVREILIADGSPLERTSDALTRYLAQSFAAKATQILSWDRSKSATINESLERSGFVVEKMKGFFKKDLEGYESPYTDPFTYASLDEFGREAFIALMVEAAHGDPFEDASKTDPKSEFDELVEMAGSRFDPTGWWVARIEGKAAGVLLPQQFPDSESEGTIFYVGVVPAFRGRGYGRILHAAGLASLASRGVRSYIGSTDTRNHPMLRIFEVNCCTRTGTQLFYAPPGA